MSTLQKSFDWKALLALGLGCVVGWSWVIYSGMWGSLGGTMGGVLGFVIVAILCSFVGLVYAELSSTYPKAGGEVIFSIEALGLGAARVAQWMCLLSWVGLLAVEAIGIPVILTTIGFTVPQVVPLYQFAGETVYLSYILVSIGINGIFAVINILGASISGTVQKWAVYLLLAAAVFFCVSGIALGEPANMEPLFTTPQAVFTVLLMLPGRRGGQGAPQDGGSRGHHYHLGRRYLLSDDRPGPGLCRPAGGSLWCRSGGARCGHRPFQRFHRGPHFCGDCRSSGYAHYLEFRLCGWQPSVSGPGPGQISARNLL